MNSGASLRREVIDRHLFFFFFFFFFSRSSFYSFFLSFFLLFYFFSFFFFFFFFCFSPPPFIFPLFSFFYLPASSALAEKACRAAGESDHLLNGPCSRPLSMPASTTRRSRAISRNHARKIVGVMQLYGHICGALRLQRRRNQT